MEPDARSKLDEPKQPDAPFLLRSVRDLKVPEKLRMCAFLCMAGGLIPTLALLYFLKPDAGGAIEKEMVTSAVIWTVVIQVAGLTLALSIGRQVLRDISGSLSRLGSLVRSIKAGDADPTIDMGNRQDEIGALGASLQRMIALAKEDRQKLVQGNVALVQANERLAATNMELESANAKVRNLAEQAGEANLAKRNFLAVMKEDGPGIIRTGVVVIVETKGQIT